MPTKTESETIRGRYWGYAAILIPATHLQLSLVLPDGLWTTSIGVGATCLLACAFCVSRAVSASAVMRWRWLLLAIAFLLWTAAYVAIGLLQDAGLDVSKAHIDSLLYMLRGVPFLLLLSQSGLDETRTTIQIADGVQAALFALLMTVLLYPAVGPGQPQPMTDYTALIYHDVQNFGLALLSLITLGCWKPAELRRFDFALAMLLTTYAVIAWMVNHLSIHALPAPPPGAPINVVADVPMIIFLVIAAGTTPVPNPLPESRLRLVVSLILPVAFCCASVLTAIAISPTRLVIAMLGGIAAVTLFAVRSAVAQARLVEARRDLSSARDELRALANIDALTDLPNRRYFDDRLSAEWRRLARFSGTLAIAVIDVDHFKLYNDAQGHPAGDACLRRVADLMRACVRREGDFLARYGGEEFALVSKVADDREAVHLADVVRTAVETAKLPHPAAERGIVTVSIGVTVGQAHPDGNPRTLVERADAALYRAKSNGRNRVEIEPAIA